MVFLPGIEEPGSEDHDGFTSALFQLHLDGGKLAMDDLHHALNFLGRYGPRPTLLAEEVHHMRCKLITCLQILKECNF